MKTRILTIALLLSVVAWAQPDRERMRMSMEKVEAKKIAYITDRLDLSPKQAQTFWPVYNEYNDKVNAARKEQLESIRPKGDEKKRFEDLSDKEIDEMMQMRFKMERKELDLKMEYHERFKDVLEIRQVAELYRAEHEFKRVLFKTMRGEHRGAGKAPKSTKPFKEEKSMKDEKPFEE